MKTPLTNEQLAIEIQTGNNELYTTLWQNVEKLITKLAYSVVKQYQNRCDSCGVCVDDIIQSGFIALCDAVKYYNPDNEYKLTTYLKFTFKNQINELLGNITKKEEPLNFCGSLNELLPGEDNAELITQIKDETSLNDFEDIEHNDYLRDLHNEFIKAFEDLTADEFEVIKNKYYKCLTYEQTADNMNTDYKTVHSLSAMSMKKLRKHRNKLKPFVDWVSYSYRASGYSAFKYSGTAVQQRIIEYKEWRNNL